MRRLSGMAVAVLVTCGPALSLAVSGPAAAAAPAARTPAAPATATAGGTWGSAKEVPGLSALTTRYADMYAVSCAEPGECAAGGDYLDKSFSDQGFVVTQTSGRWESARPVPGLAGLNAGGRAEVTAVSCASPGNCAAGGFYTDRLGNVQSFVVSEKKGAWGDAAEVPGSAALNSGGFAGIVSVSCASPGNCAAGGNYLDAAGLVQPFVMSEKDGSWGSAQPTGTAGGSPSAGINSQVVVSCAAPGYCTGGGYENNGQAFITTETDGTWGGAQPVPGLAALNAGSDARIDSVSCPSAADCAVAGSYADGSGDSRAFAAGEKGGTWQAAVPVTGPIALSSVSCPSAGDCAAAGGSYVVSEKNGTWGSARALNMLGYSVSCSAAGDCVVGGSSSGHAVVAEEAAGEWRSLRTLGGDTTAATAASCPTAGNCAVVGDVHDNSTGTQDGWVAGETDPVVGIYSTFAGTSDVKKAAGEGWGLLAGVGGLGKYAPRKVRSDRSTCHSPWLGPVPGSSGSPDSDWSVEQALSKHASPRPEWISYWTPAVPPAGTSLYDAGRAAGRTAAADIESAIRAVLAPQDPAIPVYVALDFEASAASGSSALSCGTNVKPEHEPGHKKPVYPKKKDGDKQCWEWTGAGTRNCFLVDEAGWKDFALGWAAGVSDAGPVPLDPAIYVTRDQYRRNAVGSYGASRPGGLPVIEAVDPILGGTPVKGASIAGFAGFYGQCDKVTADADVKAVHAWGGRYDSIQFTTAAAICPP